MFVIKVAVVKCAVFSVEQLHRDYLRAGSDVMQTFTFFATDDRLDICGESVSSRDMNTQACK